MNTKEFMSALVKGKKHPLKFQLPGGRVVPVGYHLTEVKNNHVESVDCGGVANQWNETVIQLWVPVKLDPKHRMSAEKALKILIKADEIRPSDPDAICLFEVDNENGTATIYTPRQVKQTTATLTIILASRQTECKALTREDSGNSCQPAGRCCT